MNFSFLITPSIFASSLENFLVMSSNLISIRGQLSSTSISNNLILLSAKVTLSSAPGASNFL